MASGSVIRLAMRRDSLFSANGVPRCGAAMKMARLTCGMGLNCRNSLSSRLSAGSSPPRARAGWGNAAHNCWSALDTSSRASTPPMLWPTSTMSREAGALPCGSKCASVWSSTARMECWLKASGALVG